jgi:sulfatase modifying factor 1
MSKGVFLMRKFLYPGIILSLLLLTVLSGCGGGSSSKNPGGTTYTTGQSSTYTVGSGSSAVSFKMNYAPSGSFTSDDSTVSGNTDLPANISVTSAYWIAQTDVTYQLWSAVYTWATTTAANKYTFANAGVEGSSGTAGAAPTTDNNQHPVTTVSWRDAMVWCNALTEYYNATNGTSLACVYCTDTTYGTPIRSVDTSSTITTTAGTEDNPCVNSSAKGFRLPTSGEWELAARYQDGTNWTPGDHVSGDTSGYCEYSGISSTESTIFGNYAWYHDNSSTSTHPVGQKTANALGLYDMSGNVMQWCFDWYPGFSARVARGGDWSSFPYNLRLGLVGGESPNRVDNETGFRPVRAQ